MGGHDIHEGFGNLTGGGVLARDAAHTHVGPAHADKRGAQAARQAILLQVGPLLPPKPADCFVDLAKCR